MRRRRPVRVRSGFWLMLVLVLAASGAMKLLAWRAKLMAEPSEVQAAVYRYPPDSAPFCEHFIDRSAWRAEWMRIDETSLPPTQPHGCRQYRGVAM